MKQKPDDVATKKVRFLEALEKNHGNILETCKAAGVSRQWFYRNASEDPEFSAAADAARDSIIDLAESALVKAVRREDWPAVLKVLNSKGAKRGWSEKQQVEMSGEVRVSFEEKLRLAIEKANVLRH